MSIDDWIKDATASTDDESEAMRIGLPDGVRKGIRADTSSSQAEVDALMRRLRTREVATWSTLAWLRPALVGGGLMVAGVAAAAAIGVVVAPQILAPDTFTDAPTPTAMRLEVGQVRQVSPEVSVSGLGDLSVDRLHDGGTDLSLLQGLARFDVSTDPSRRLLVAASDVSVSVTGESLFSIQRLGEEIEVDVDEGEVGVVWGDVSITLSAGQSWTRGGEVAAVIPVRTEAPIDAVADVDDPAEDVGEADAPAPRSPTPAPAVAVPPRTAPGTAEPAPSDAASASEADPCAIDPWSIACRASRRPAAVTSPETRYQSMQRAMSKVDRTYSAASEVVSDANNFLERFADHPRADEVRYFRVRAAFFGARASTTIAYADAFLAGTSDNDVHREEVQQMRRVATLRRDVMNDAQRTCAGADPLLAELVRLEAGTKRNEALARRGLCAQVNGDAEAAKAHLSQVQVDRLPVDLKAEVREAWTTLVPEPVDRKERR